MSLFGYSDSIAASAMLDDPDSICIVRECQELEAEYSPKLTDTVILTLYILLRDVKNDVLLSGKTMLLDLCYPWCYVV